MDAASIAETLQLSLDKVQSVMRSYNDDETQIQSALHQFLDSQSGPFQEVQEYKEVEKATREAPGKATLMSSKFCSGFLSAIVRPKKSSGPKYAFILNILAASVSASVTFSGSSSERTVQ